MKKKYFNSIPNLTLVPVSKWLEGEVRKSFLKNVPLHQIYNGIDLETFKPSFEIDIRAKYQLAKNTKIVLGVASNWYRKGLQDFVSLSNTLPEDYKIILVGINEKDAQSIPEKIIAIRRTENINEMRCLYSQANVFFNPTIEDNFPTTNIESLACDTPIVTYKTGGCEEAISAETGYAVEPKNLEKAKGYILEICEKDKKVYQLSCRQRAMKLFDKNERFIEFINLYKQLI